MKRIVALVGHAHCGKTSLAESLLFAGGAISRKGGVKERNSVSDFNDDERERQISINASCLKIAHKNHQIQLIDTPGYADFIGETVSVLKVADAAIVVVDAVHGVEVGTEDVWQRLSASNIPRLIFINKIEKEGASLDETVSMIHEQLSPGAQVIDLASPKLVDAVAESDDELLEKYLEKGSLSPEEVSKGLRKGVLAAKIFPVLTGSALEDKGIKEILDYIVDYLPSPLERSFKTKTADSEEAEAVIPSEDGPFAGFIFKSMFDPHLGHLSLMRVVRGSINANATCFNATASEKEHIGTMSMLQGKEQVSLEQATCGDIVAMAKLKNTHVGDTLTDPREKVMLETIEFPEPSISASIKPKTRADEEKIASSLHRLCEEDHTFQSTRNAETKELIISGVGDLHLKVMLERMKNRYHVDVELGTPKVSYRETITRKGKARHKYKKQSGGRGQYGDVDLEIEPLGNENEQYEFVSKIFGGAIPKNYIPSVEKGVQQTVREGILAGYPVYNLRVTVVDGSYHEVDSSDMAFQIASTLALKEAFKQAGPTLLEPIMEVSIAVPSDFIGQVTRDISSRRGRIMGSGTKGKREIVKAHIPLAEMFKYATDLRSMTGGRGSYSMKRDHYAQVPAKIIEAVVAERQKK